MRFGPGWYETDPRDVALGEEVFSAPFPLGLGLGALPGLARTASPKESSLGELPLTAGFPKESFPKETSSPRASSPWVESRPGFQIDTAEIREGRFDPKALNVNAGCIRAVLPLLGQTDLGTPAPCCLPGGTGTASITRSKRGHYLYSCPCHGNGKGRSVTDAYAAKISGNVKLRTGDVYFIWTIRLLAKIGAVVPHKPPLPPLPDDADASTIKVYEGLGLLIGLRALTAFPPEFTFSRSFVMDWCQLAEDAARAGIEALREALIIEKVGETKVGRHPANLYRVGTGS